MAAGVEIGDRAGVAIRRRMRELGLSQPDLGRALGRSHSWVNMYLLERPAYTLRRMWVQNPDLIARLLKALQWTPEEFTRETGIELPTMPAKLKASMTYMERIPLVGVVSAARGDSMAEPMGYVEVDSSVVSRHSGYTLFALEVDGDSMYCEDLPFAIPPGAIVVVAKEKQPSPGDIVVAWHREKEVGYLKQWFPKDGYQVLRSWNPDVPPMVVQGQDEVEIQGVVVQIVIDPSKVSVKPRGR
mgnify:CR=1 FL=1